MNGMPVWLRHKIAGQMKRKHRLRAALVRGGLDAKAADLAAEIVVARRLLRDDRPRGGEPGRIFVP